MPDNWKKKATDRRDERNIKSPDAEKYPKPSKNKRKWCRGKTGVEHQPKCVDFPGITNGKLLTCEKCNKRLDMYMPWGGITPPEWAK
jgi:hypothetical protein